MARARAAVCFALLALAGIARGALLTSSKQCVLSDTNAAICSYGDVPQLESVSRQARSCANDDYECMCLEAVELVNQIRRKNDKPDLKVGSISMLTNAVAHSRDMAVNNFFEHQELSEVTQEIGCGLFCSGENIASNTGRMNVGSAASRCVDQWEGSPPHLDNILSDTHEFTSIGIFNSGEQSLCTQTFSTTSGSAETSGRCAPVSDNNETTNQDDTRTTTQPPTTTSTQPPTTTWTTQQTSTSDNHEMSDSDIERLRSLICEMIPQWC